LHMLQSQKTGLKEEQIIHSDQDVQVCGKYVEQRCTKTLLYMISLPFFKDMAILILFIYLDLDASNSFFSMLGPLCVQLFYRTAASYLGSSTTCGLRLRTTRRP
jgi:hypothetical protein